MQTYPTGYAESHHIAEQIFREILPRHGMAVREEQIALCHEVLDTLYNKEISLCEAGVGTGKTLAYLVGCILWQMNRPERMKLPIVISTSSVALQDAILTEYLPDLSAVLLDEGIITAPITAVVRKGKERFVCDARLAERASLVQPSRKRQTNSLNIAAHILDMDHIPELSRYDRCRICVPQSCPRDCFMRLDCRYQQYLRDSMKPDIQICNHNYLLADASHRLEDRPLLLRSYQALVVDEAHKLPDAARQMYTETLSSRAMDELCLLLQQAHYKDFARQLRTTFLTLSFSCTQGFSKLRRKVSEPFVLTPFRRAALIDCIALLQNAGGLPDVPRYLLNRLGEAESLLRLFLLEVPTRILYIDYDADGQPTFCAASNRVPQLLRSALWNTREPAILTSGTLAAAGDFSHTEQLLGLTTYRPLRHFRADSPFNYKKKCLLYFPPRTKTRIEEVAIFPQGYAALLTEVGLLQDEPSMLLMDLGGWTVDLMRIDNAIPAADTAHSLELGMIRCVDDIREQVRRETGLSLTDAQIENMLAGQPCTVSDTVRDIVNKQGRKYTEHLLSATMEAGFDLHAIPAVLLGGGASVVSRHLSPKDGLCKTIFLLDDKVNAVGFERALAAVSRRKSEV